MPTGKPHPRLRKNTRFSPLIRAVQDKPHRARRIRLDGEIVDAFDLPHGHWEAKDTHDDLPTEAQRKAEAGYPFKNIIIQSPTRALLYQNGHLRLDVDLTDPSNLINLLNTFFAYQEENIVDWYAGGGKI